MTSSKEQSNRTKDDLLGAAVAGKAARLSGNGDSTCSDACVLAKPADLPTDPSKALVAGPNCESGALTLDETFTAKANEVFRSKVTPKKAILIVLTLVAAAFISLCLGRYTCNPIEMLSAFQNFFYNIYMTLADPQNWANLFSGKGFVYHEEMWDPKLYNAVINIRFPRILCVILVGAALSMAGASYQGMFKNPLVSPDLLGASAGAGFGACLAMLINAGSVQIQIMAFAGAMISVGCAVWLTRIVKSDALLGLILGGILVGTLFQSGTSIIKLLADADDKLPSITFWLMGSFARITMRDIVIAIPMVIGFVLLLIMAWRLNVLSFGEEEARSLGVNVRSTRLIVILAATLITACSVSISGIIGYVGLVVPHLARAIVGPDYRALLPASLAIGGVFLLVVDNISRLMFATEIPIGILTSIIGVPFFIFIYRKDLKGW